MVVVETGELVDVTFEDSPEGRDGAPVTMIVRVCPPGTVGYVGGGVFHCSGLASRLE